MTDQQSKRLNELHIYARKMRDEATSPSEREKWTNVMTWVLLIEENQ